jgi:hypothetical protein
LAKPTRAGTIEIEQDLDFQRRSWTVQRVGWIMMLLISIGGLFGVFGGGLLANASVGDDGELRVDYERLVRMTGSQQLEISVGQGATQSSTMSLWLDREWLSRHKVRSILPEPDSTSVSPVRVTYHFKVDPAAGPSKVEFDLETHAFGRMRGKVGIPGGKTVTFDQFSYP